MCLRCDVAAAHTNTNTTSTCQMRRGIISNKYTMHVFGHAWAQCGWHWYATCSRAHQQTDETWNMRRVWKTANGCRANPSAAGWVVHERHMSAYWTAVSEGEILNENFRKLRIPKKSLTNIWIYISHSHLHWVELYYQMITTLRRLANSGFPYPDNELRLGYPQCSNSPTDSCFGSFSNWIFSRRQRTANQN